MRRIVALWLLAFIFSWSPAAFAMNTENKITKVSNGNGGGGHASATLKPCHEVTFARLGADPVEPGWQPDPKEYKILVLTEESCGQVDGAHRTERLRLRVGTGLAVPLSGKGELKIVACGNRYVPEGTLVGKYFECPACSQPEVRTIEVPGPERIVYQEREIQAPPTVQKKHRVWPWVVAILSGVAIGLASRGGGDNDHGGCDTCPPRDKPAP